MTNAQINIIKSKRRSHEKICPAENSNNKINPLDRSFHNWYRFVLSFPPHLVQHYLNLFGATRSSTVLDPFCGTGTTIVESKLSGFKSIGIEANPIAHFASTVKVDWSISPEDLFHKARRITKRAYSVLQLDGIDDENLIHSRIKKDKLRILNPEANKLLLKNSISPLPLHKSLILLDEINRYREDSCHPHLLLAFAKTLVFRISNLKFGPEVGVSKPKSDAQVIGTWQTEVNSMVSDLQNLNGNNYQEAKVIFGDSRNIGNYLRPKSIDVIITSPPYPNEKDYTRTTRLESVLLGFFQTKTQLREYKKGLIRSNTRNVYKGDDDSLWIKNNRDIQNIAIEIERRRIELGKTSGFEKLYPTVTKLYFGGMARHFEELKKVLRPGAMLAYVVGDQASYLRVMIRTGTLIADIAKNLGYEVVSIDLFRTRFATVTGEQLREEVVVLRWPGKER